MNTQFCYKYPHPAVTADCLIFGFSGNQTYLLLIERKNEPYKGCWAFPGGFINIDESAETAALRELNEETGIKGVEIHQLHTFSDVHRDPRERVITIAFYGIVNKANFENVKGGDDARKAQWFSLSNLPKLAFDHEEILTMALQTIPQLKRTPRIAADHITQLDTNEIFVFGSNLEGAHGGGAAFYAKKKFGAIWGQGVGLQGKSYGIPTMHGGVESIKPYVDDFINFAKLHPEYKFLVTQIGCGIAGFAVEEIAPLFHHALEVDNIYLPQSFVDCLTT